MLIFLRWRIHWGCPSPEMEWVRYAKKFPAVQILPLNQETGGAIL